MILYKCLSIGVPKSVLDNYLSWFIDDNKSSNDLNVSFYKFVKARESSRLASKETDDLISIKIMLLEEFGYMTPKMTSFRGGNSQAAERAFTENIGKSSGKLSSIPGMLKYISESEIPPDEYVYRATLRSGEIRIFNSSLEEIKRFYESD